MKTTSTYSVPEINLGALLDKIGKLNKRAKKLNSPAIEITYEQSHVNMQLQYETGHGYESYWCHPADAAKKLKKKHKDTGRRMPVYRVTITGESPSYDGWTFVATLEPMTTDEGVENIFRTAPGQTCPAEFRNRVGVCDHCKTKRYRKETFVCRHETGRYVSVGRQCIKDFLAGHPNPDSLAGMAEIVFQADHFGHMAGDYGWCGGGEAPAWDLEMFMRWTAAVVRNYGWVSRGKAFDSYGKLTASADRVLYLLTPPNRLWSEQDKHDWQAEVDKCQPIDADRDLAADMVDWAENLSEVDCNTSDYLGNLNVIARHGYVTRKNAGYAASISVAYYKAHQKNIKRQEWAKRSNEHIGTIGKREVMTLTVEKIIETEGRYGFTAIHRMVDGAGNSVIWFASDGSSSMNEGETYEVKATVKKHDEYKGRKQTVVNRVAVQR